MSSVQDKAFTSVLYFIISACFWGTLVVDGAEFYYDD